LIQNTTSGESDFSDAVFSISTSPAPIVPAPIPVVGGQCTYKKTSGVCTIYSIDKAGIVSFLFATSSKSIFPSYFNPNAMQQADLSTLTTGWNVANRNFLAIGTQISCAVNILTTGTCTPVTFNFNSIISPNPSVTVLSPSAGQTWQTGKTYTIIWGSSGFDKLSIGYKSYNAAAGSSGWIAKNISAVSGSYNWTIPSNFYLVPEYGNTQSYMIIMGTEAQVGSGIGASSKPFYITSNAPVCVAKWWFDNTTRVCSQKQFCGQYLYYGLQTFDTKADCQAHLP
jgi:hypothetical protein